MCSPDQGHPRKPSETGIPTSNYPRCTSESLKYRQKHIFQDFVMVPKTNKIANLLFDTTGLPQLWGFMAVFHKPCCNSTLDLCLRIQFLWVNLMMAKCNRATGHWSTTMKKENHKKANNINITLVSVKARMTFPSAFPWCLSQQTWHRWRLHQWTRWPVEQLWWCSWQGKIRLS